MYPRFQVFDTHYKPVSQWEPQGYRIDDDDSLAGACRPEPQWIDNDRFIVFWTDYCFTPYNYPLPLVSRVFSQRGAVKHPIRLLVLDSLWLYNGVAEGMFSYAASSDGRFAYTHTRSHYDYPDSSKPNKERHWEHGAGILGEIINNEPYRRTNLFEYTPVWGQDTVNSVIGNWSYVQAPAVACYEDRVVWVYSRFNPDTIFEAYALISDWDMGVGLEESPIPASPYNFEVKSCIGTAVILSYSDFANGFRASVYDASGRKVDELSSSKPSGTIAWGESQRSGVYFIHEMSGRSTHKVVLVR